MADFTRRDIGAIAFGAAVTAAFPAAGEEPANWRIGFETPPAELDGELTLVSGRLPADLEGAFYRIGPAQFERAGERLGHWFDGDGMVQRFAIDGGRVRHRGRFVATDKRRMEEEAGRFLYSGYGFAPQNGVAFRRPDEINAANTNVVAVGGDIWALWEGGSPWRVDVESLDTIGRKTFAGPFDGLPFSAHPKKGPDGDLWNFGMIGPRCVIWRIGADGALKSAAPFDLPAPGLMHDFTVTHRHIVFFLPPLLLTGGGRSLVDNYAWRPDEPLRILVLDKSDLSISRRYELPARFMFHFGNAWEDAAGVIRVDASIYDDAQFATSSARDLPQGRYVGAVTARPALFALHPDGRAQMEPLDSVGEFPRIDPRRVGGEHRFTYGVITSGVARWDWRRGRRTAHVYGPDHWAEEPVFAPKPHRTRESDGWVLATALNMQAKRTELAVFDAGHLEDGPIALLACPYVLPLGFHGAFVGA